MKQRTRRQQIAFVEHPLRQCIGIDAGIDPTEQPRRLRHERAVVRERELDRAGTRAVEPDADAVGVPAQLSLIDTPRQRALEQCGRRERRKQLGFQQPAEHIGRRRHEADTPVRRQYLCESAHIDRALQSIERTQARGVFGRKVAVSVVFDDMEVVLVSKLQHAMRAARRQAVAGRVVQHADTDKKLRLMRFAIPRHYFEIGSISAARHRQDAHAERFQPCEFDRPARLLNHHRIARAQQRPAHDVQRMRGADGRDDLVRRGRHVDAGELLRQAAP